MTNHCQNAITIFRTGMNCAQAVLTTFSKELNFDIESAAEISSGFGGGMGRLQETCGAVTGAFMVLGIYTSRKYSDTAQRKENLYTLIQEFNSRFSAIHKTTNCRLLLGIDLKTPEGRRVMSAQNLSEHVCEKCITDSVLILEELIK